MPDLEPATDRSRPASRLATVLGNLYLILGSLVCATVVVLVGWLTPDGRIMFRVARWWSAGLLRASGVRLRSEVEEPLVPGRSYVFMANHQSLFDIPALLVSLPMRARFMAKRELFRIPLFGWSLRMGRFIPVDRDRGSRARHAFSAAVKSLEDGASVLIFPEETRSADGRLLPFRRGGFLLALKSGAAVVPVGIRGTGEIRPRETYRIRPGEVQVRFGRPLPPAGYGIKDRAAFTAEVRARIAALAGVREGDGSAGAGAMVGAAAAGGAGDEAERG